MFAAIASASMEDKGHVTLTTVKFREASDAPQPETKERPKATTGPAGLEEKTEEKPHIDVTFAVNGLCTKKGGFEDPNIAYECDGKLSMKGMLKSDTSPKPEEFILDQDKTKLAVGTVNGGVTVNIIIKNRYPYVYLSTYEGDNQKESKMVFDQLKEIKEQNAVITWTINENMLRERIYIDSEKKREPLQNTIEKMKKKLDTK